MRREMSHPFVDEVRAEMATQANADDAPIMQAYMKTDQPFYGVKSKVRRSIFRAVRRRYPIGNRDEYRDVIFDLWHGVYREEMYLSLDVVEFTKPYRDVESWPIYVELMKTAPWWDTLDWIAGKIMSLLILDHRKLEQALIQWRVDENMWVRRASLLAHLKHKAATNTELLAETIEMLAHEEEFFIRKAIGWVLREYSKTDPDWVGAFVRSHEGALSPLSKREAMKYVT